MRKKLITGIQLMVVFFLLAYSFQQIFIIVNGRHRLKTMIEGQSYVIIDDSTEELLQMLWDEEEETKKRLEEFFHYLEQSSCTYCLSWEYPLPLTEGGERVKHLTVDRNFLDIYHFDLVKGKIFQEQDFEIGTGESLPIIIGYDLQNEYELGQTYFFEDPGTGKEFQGKITGVLKKNSTYVQLSDLTEISLNQTYLVPFDMNRMLQDGSLSDYDMALQSLIVIADSKEEIDAISRHLTDTNTFSMKFVKMSDTLDEFVNYMMPQIVCQLIIALIIFFFAMAKVQNGKLIFWLTRKHFRHIL